MAPAMADRTTERLLTGPAAFTAQLEAVLDQAYRLATVMLGDRTAAEDAVQEAALKACSTQGQLRGGADSFKTWFLSIVANECRMARRSRWWHVMRMHELPLQPGSVEDLAAAGDLRAASAKLGPTDETALFCYFYLDLPMDQVARVLRVSPAAARSRVYRAAQRLRPDLDPSEDL